MVRVARKSEPQWAPRSGFGGFGFSPPDAGHEQPQGTPPIGASGVLQRGALKATRGSGSLRSSRSSALKPTEHRRSSASCFGFGVDEALRALRLMGGTTFNLSAPDMPHPLLALDSPLALVAARVRSTGGHRFLSRLDSNEERTEPPGGLRAGRCAARPGFCAEAPAVDPRLLSDFVLSASALRSRMSRPAWLRARVVDRDGEQCWWCEQPAFGMASLFSRALGGLPSFDNTVMACPACTQRFADVDPIADHWRSHATRWTLLQAAQRMRALAEATQHALPRATGVSVTKAMASLEKLRHAQPRVAIAVFHGEAHTLLTPISKPCAMWASLARHARSLGARTVADAPDVLWLPSSEWEETAWSLIEVGALLRRVQVTGWADAVATGGNAMRNPGGGVARWDELFRGTRAVARAAKVAQ